MASKLGWYTVFSRTEITISNELESKPDSALSFDSIALRDRNIKNLEKLGVFLGSLANKILQI